MEYVQENVNRIRHRIEEATTKAHRSIDEVRIIAVTKTTTAEVLPYLVDAGVVDAAENRWQVAREKLQHPVAEQLEWHFIGTLQTNKVKYIVPNFAWVHSVDRLELAMALSDEAVKRNCKLNLLMQVNVAQEVQKHGFHPDEVKGAAKQMASLPNVNLRGLMTMAPHVEDVEDVRPVFQTLASLRLTTAYELGLQELTELSMGMSEDYAVAVEEGATMVRIGRQLVQRQQ